MRWSSRSLALLGLIAGPALWALTTQAGQILPYRDCAQHLHFSAILGLACAILALGSGYISSRSERMRIGPRTLGFVAALSVLAALIFAFAILLQAAAALILSGCER
jgi:hypothetical protein